MGAEGEKQSAILEAEGHAGEAEEAYLALGDFLDSAEKAQALTEARTSAALAQAQDLMESGSWQDALKYGFLSADETNSGRYLRNIHVGDTIYCHIAGYGFLGIGICTSKAVYMKDFNVSVNGVSTPILKAPWVNQDKKDQLVTEKEIFIGVDWKKSVPDDDRINKAFGLKKKG